MGYSLAKDSMNAVLAKLGEKYDIYAPVVFKGQATFSDLDNIRYGKVSTLEEIEFDTKSEYSFKEVLLPIQQNLFYFVDDETTIPKISDKGIMLLMRSCDIHALKRLDQIYLNNGPKDFYYERLREKAKIVLIGCPSTCKHGFCVSMGTNTTEDYDMYLKLAGEEVSIECKDEELDGYFADAAAKDVKPDFVTENNETVNLPKHLSNDSFKNPIWEEYGARCIQCGRCNFVCPTCTCFTMQDIYYQENKNVGERRRVWASCQIDNYDTIAGGIKFRRTMGDRVRFKVMHKVYDYEKRFGYPMCVGCGRCEEVCPEYISYISIVNRLAEEEA